MDSWPAVFGREFKTYYVLSLYIAWSGVASGPPHYTIVDYYCFLSSAIPQIPPVLKPFHVSAPKKNKTLVKEKLQNHKKQPCNFR